MKRKIIAIVLLFSRLTNAQDLKREDVKKEVIRILDSINRAKLSETKTGDIQTDHWYEKFSLRGYDQIKYNGLFSTNCRVSQRC